ncbi:MAG: DegT/DnrJ/EryC1/StrS family aminotransferase, partial [Silvanigrellaceae bacterium]|nr:DegT/DnrJ/EryC1/StrS family aminotransferase [Silvanigrellaceae bacterium]
MVVRLSMASVDEKEINEIKKVFFETVNFGLGIHVQQFESEIQKFIGIETNVICVNTGTNALHLALSAL